MGKLPASEEQVTVTYKLGVLEQVLRALKSKKKELEGYGARSARTLSLTQEAITVTNEAIKETLERRKARDNS
jgi:hypothetical protein